MALCLPSCEWLYLDESTFVIVTKCPPWLGWRIFRPGGITEAMGTQYVPSPGLPQEGYCDHGAWDQAVNQPKCSPRALAYHYHLIDVERESIQW